FRDGKTASEKQWEYLEFLRSLFKSSGTTDRIFAAAYMTGILPMKKDGSQSAISEFREYTMFDPMEFAPYIGFTEEEVKALCEKHDMDYGQMKYWYDGYSFPGVGSIYKPNSVMETICRKNFKSYWVMTSATDSLLHYINMDFDGLGEAAEKLLSGIPVPIEITEFGNDPRVLRSRDAVLTLLIHYGYFSYDPEMEWIRIPNEEIRSEFAGAIRKMTHAETIRRVKESDKLLLDMVNQDEEAVAAQIEKIHMEECSPRHYNGEQSLRSVIKLACFVYKDEFVQLEELPGGTGFADIVYLPKKRSDFPILLIELKWDKDAEGAIAQIKNRQYPKVLEGYGSEILLVGISYDKEDKEKKHHCRIEEWELI
ncbi:MAG: AAA family ATPase, partial [Lachnospiraceae bacterium]|nr:AAA family ATPase [Lachnospiraceae bacterium]